MEGVYENFPVLHHGIAFFSHKISTQDLQRILICLFYRVNRGEEVFEIPVLSRHGIRMVFEIGIADGLEFNFIDEEEKNRWLSLLTNRIFETLDFIWIVRYYVSKKGKNRPLKFDYYMLRFIFRPEAMELRIHHERGTRRLSIEDLIKTIGEKINKELERKEEPPLRLESLGAF
ncbi:TPA: hypothetical protein EYP75_04660 [Candidatus Bathyarchaeota archaeon]|nr:hypothetical protein [Candidatus Bathyarchaeota archaeon]